MEKLQGNPAVGDQTVPVTVQSMTENKISLLSEGSLSDGSTKPTIEPIALTVKQFLTSRPASKDPPAAVVMDHLTVEGAGTGVSETRRYTRVQMKANN